MKKIFIFLLSACAFFGSLAANAQTFSKAGDTVRLTYVGTGEQALHNNIIVPSTDTAPVVVRWKIISCNFPADWLSAGSPGMCDNNQCYSFFGPGGLWPGGATNNSLPYTVPTTNGDFHLVVSLGVAGVTTGGTYYVTARLQNKNIPNDTTTATFAVTYNPPSEVPTVKSLDNILLYPNPANNEINVVYDANSDVKTIAVYNIIGRPVSAYRVSGNSANLNLEALPAGIYFVRLVNSQGEVLITRKFTKQ